jgi:glycosyltransferase involved in cell wall biosynthesis
LRILGDGPERSRLERLAGKLGIAHQVEFLGRVPSTDAPQYYRQLDIFVLPSLSRPNWVEQFGRVLVEAMACGVPVVGSASGEIPWVIGDAGVLFPEGEVEALTQILQGLIDDEGRRGRLAAAGRARVLAQFTQAQIAESTARVYAAL